MSELSDIEKKALKLLRSKRPKTVREAVSILEKNMRLKDWKAAQQIYILWKKGYLDLKPGKRPSSFAGYLVSLEALWLWILTAIVLLTMALVFLVKEPPLVYLRYVLGSLYVLYLPGAALIEALYPRGELEPLERLALSIGLSLALTPLVGLVLNYTPWGIRLTPVTLSLAGLTIAEALTAAYRKYQYRRAAPTAQL